MRSDGLPIHEITSISGVGFGFLALVVGVHRAWITRQEGADRANRMLRSLGAVKRFHGAFPHFIQTAGGKTIPFAKFDDGGDLVETALLVQGLICAREFFDRQTADEIDLRRSVADIVETVEWAWFTQGKRGPLFWHWSPRYGWAKNLPIVGWNEALVSYVLAAGSTADAIDPASYHAGWARNGEITNGTTYLGVRLPLGEPFGGPLFLSHYSFCTLDPRGLGDVYCSDYLEQVHAHSLINYRYCSTRYAPEDGWGLSACDGPKGYVVNSPTDDHGIIATTAALSSMPFLPLRSKQAAERFLQWHGGALVGRFGLMDSFEPTTGWVSKTHLAINQGPVVAMMENHRSGLIWDLFMNAQEIQTGLCRLGFRNASQQARREIDAATVRAIPK
ncbi:hypothetical protein EN41_25180 [Agrobacterium tumefaciens]|uniref:Glycoamylase-like domain-containing protein n=1 Tax=Agrobacterium fabrum (strain C58 / ATCC 33970) TaxID=176299 RepID=Q7CRH0_AGRFC|nr:glucoamylase family protein [Agrobacterium fabrum]KEY53903.1 hypothetical protein EN41_25180 [Agrobacterium tumefaciens]AAK90328.2 conserved hypothetical protein [Agrobacterium fabrum str. C58]AYM58875.1 hypothetical protein At1D132_28630 [Agrobacterium fabrum]MCX2877918.1 hypothetical protein [Agrobacterium fabrum]QRM60764.1 hypothetical protein F3P66_14805 [Agrobacterium fabrum]